VHIYIVKFCPECGKRLEYQGRVRRPRFNHIINAFLSLDIEIRGV